MVYKCPKGCFEKTGVSRISMKGKMENGKYVQHNFDKDDGKELICPVCGLPLEDTTVRPVVEGQCASFLKVHSLNREDRMKVLKKRSADHSRMMRSKGRAL